MHEQSRLKLLFGPYRMPVCKVGGLLRCAMHGKVRVRGIHEAPIQWPCTTWESLILCGDLVGAVRRESEIAVAHWWGVSAQTVWAWRKALGVGATTKGTSELRSRWAPEAIQSDEANARPDLALQSPERTAKVATTKKAGRNWPTSGWRP